MHTRPFRTVSTLIFTLACATIAQDHYQMLMAAPWTGEANMGLYLFDTEQDTLIHLWQGTSQNEIRSAKFSPDGTKIAFYHRGGLYVMNNDGTNVVRYESHYWFQPQGEIYYTTNGVFWTKGHYINKMDPETGHVDSIAYFGDWEIVRSYDICFSQDGHVFHAWYDFMNDWYGSTFDTADVVPIPGEDRDRGTLYGVFNTDFSDFTHKIKYQWGHGNLVANDGTRMFQVYWGDNYHGTSVPKHSMIRVIDMTSPTLDPIDTISSGFATDPGGMGPVLCANDNDIIGVRNKDTASVEAGAYWWNWTSDTNTPVKLPDVGMPGFSYPAFHCLWKGALPSSGTSIALAPSSVILTAEDSTAEVTATGSGSPGTPVATVAAAAQAWLSAVVASTGTDTWSITLTASPAAAPSTQTDVTVTVEATGASAKTITVTYSPTTTVLVAPTDLTVSAAGDSGYDVQVSWTDGSTGEDGFSIERSDDGGPWAVVGTVGGDVTAFTDSAVAAGEYSYRVRAYAGSSYSGYSTEAAVSVTGYKWIRLTMPADKQFTPGAEDTVTWTANMVTNVAILISTDDGESWDELNATGGVTTAMPDWGAFVFTVPQTTADSIMLQVRDYMEHGTFAQARYAVGTAAISAMLPAGPHAGLSVSQCPTGLLIRHTGAAPVRVVVHTLGGRTVARAVLDENGTASRIPLGPSGSYVVTADCGGQLLRQTVVRR